MVEVFGGLVVRGGQGGFRLSCGTRGVGGSFSQSEQGVRSNDLIWRGGVGEWWIRLATMPGKLLLVDCYVGLRF